MSTTSASSDETSSSLYLIPVLPAPDLFFTDRRAHSSRRPGVAWRAMPKVRAGNERHNAVNPMRQYSLFLAEYCKPLRYMRNMQRRCRGGCRMRELGCGPSPHEPFARIHQRPPLCDLRSGKVPTPLSHRDCTYTLARNSRLLICLTIYHYNFSRAISEAA